MKLLKRLYSISAPSGEETKMCNYLEQYCKSLGAQVTKDLKGNLYVIKGDAETYPCIVAHMDEVCPERGKGYQVITTKSGKVFGWDSYLMEQNAIGGDDKNGIFIALKMLEREEVIKLAFFVEEETGCNGSHEAEMQFFDNARFVLQADRRGNSDFITEGAGTEFCDDDFLSDIDLKKFGYKTETGSITDVWALKNNGLNVAVANLSCGYFNPHSYEDYTDLEGLFNCLELVKHIFDNCTRVYEHKEELYSYSGDFWKDDYPRAITTQDKVTDLVDEYLYNLGYDEGEIVPEDLFTHVLKHDANILQEEIEEAYYWLLGTKLTYK